MLKEFLQMLPPETAHNLAKRAMRWRIKRSGQCSVCPLGAADLTLFGHKIKNPLGLAAGFDKNGELVDVIEDYGFGYVEVGSVTFRGGPGNKRPRMFRLGGNDIMNRMGLNGEPAHKVASRLQQVKRNCFGVNIAKTHSPDIMGDAAIRDITNTYVLVMGLGFYTVLNISCPNTKEGKTFEDSAALKELLAEIKKSRMGANVHKPMAVKLSPTSSIAALDDIIITCESSGVVDGYVVCNTMPWEDDDFGKGGRSGIILHDKVEVMLMHLRNRLDADKQLIAVGGIFDGAVMSRYMNLGANACQAYNGFVRGPYSGPDFAHNVIDQWLSQPKQPTGILKVTHA